MSYDHILVLSAGRIVEFDLPHELLKREDGGWLQKMVNESSEKQGLIGMIGRTED